jgi:phosphate transport system ATP-binding protein
MAEAGDPDVSIDVDTDNVTAFIGPSGCGKSTFLRCLNRMNDTVDSARVDRRNHARRRGHLRPGMDVVQLRARVGMVFQKPNPFPKSIYDNVAYGPRIHGLASSKADLDRSSNPRCAAPACGTRSRTASIRQRHRAFRRPAAAPLHRPRHCRRARSHPDGRTLLGARSHRHREDRGTDRRAARRYAIVIVTHNMQQAARVSQRTAFFHLGTLVEYGNTSEIFTNPRELRTKDYITGRYG